MPRELSTCPRWAIPAELFPQRSVVFKAGQLEPVHQWLHARPRVAEKRPFVPLASISVKRAPQMTAMFGRCVAASIP
jgi:hypothetical protein